MLKMCKASSLQDINFNIKNVKNPFVDNDRVYFIEYQDESISNEFKFVDDDLYIDRDDENMNRILFLRPKILLNGLENGIINGIYLDSDFIALYTSLKVGSSTHRIESFTLKESKTKFEKF